MNQIPNIEETHNTRDNSPAQVFNRREWLTMNWFTIEELDAADDKGFIGNKYGIACYLSTFIPTSSQSIPYRFVATDDIDDKEVYKGEAIVDIAELEAYIHHQLQKARPEGYEQGYTQGKFNEKMDAEYKHPEELQKARHDWLREEIVKLEGMKVAVSPSGVVEYYTAQVATNQVLQTIIDRYQSELDQDKK